ncbi:MAG: hypothetical protein HOG85_05515 [Flavobacteriales bacterium]|nr:hypothetical protein [Flavobacteriales bacterium]
MKYTIYLEACLGLDLENGNSVSTEYMDIDLGYVDCYVEIDDDNEDDDEEEMRGSMLNKIDEFIDNRSKIFIMTGDDYYIITNFPKNWGKVYMGENTGRTREIICDLTEEETIKWLKDIPTITYSEAVEKELIEEFEEE